MSEIENMDIHFDKKAEDYDRHALHDLGMSEFYDEVEKQISMCSKKDNILVLGCGTGLEIERIKNDCTVTAIDISPNMLQKLKQKKLPQGIKLKTICGSYLDIPFDENSFNIVLSTYSLHHFKVEQKKVLYEKIYNCLKDGGCLINGDVTFDDKDMENTALNNALEIYKDKNVPFGTLHIDIPLAVDTEIELLKDSRFSKITVEKKWTHSSLLKAIKP